MSTVLEILKKYYGDAIGAVEYNSTATEMTDVSDVQAELLAIPHHIPSKDYYGEHSFLVAVLFFNLDGKTVKAALRKNQGGHDSMLKNCDRILNSWDKSPTYIEEGYIHPRYVWGEL